MWPNLQETTDLVTFTEETLMEIFIFCTVLGQCLTNPFATLLKNTPTQLFSCEYCEIVKNTYFEEHLRTTASFILVSLLSTLNKFHKLTLSSPIFHFILTPSWRKLIGGFEHLLDCCVVINIYSKTYVLNLRRDIWLNFINKHLKV